MFVAGGTEEGVLPVWAGKLRANIDKVRIEPLEGEYDQRKIKIINKYISDAQTTVFLMVDSHAKEEVKQAVDEDHRLIIEGTTEDYFPIPILVQVLNKRFELTLTEDDIDPQKPRVEEIKKVLKEKCGVPRKNDFWKRSLGKEVAKLMSKDDIAEEIRDFVAKVAN